MLYIVRCHIRDKRNTLADMIDYLQAQIGLRVKILRDREGISQEAFALRIGMDRSYLASIEAGKRNVTAHNLAKLAKGFELTLSEFLEDVDYGDI